ncbi:MAG: hypothetical protein V1787_04040 [Candidatus Micrarchaeota archaeon]
MIGIDFGSTYTDVAYYSKGTVRFASFESGSFSLDALEKLAVGDGKVAVTGAVAVVEKRNPGILQLGRRLRLVKIGEIDAIARGARHLTGKGRMLVANVGTGTPFVYVDGSTARHVAGTGIGGGTLSGLARLLVNTRVENMEELARRGTPRLDLTVGEAVGGGVGIVGGDATASNFGKAASAKRVHNEDVALSTINLVAEAVGTMALLAAKGCGCEKDIVFTGRAVARNKLMQEKIGEVMRLFGGKAVFPENAEYCTAMGALLSLGK